MHYNGVLNIGSYIKNLNPFTILNRLGNEIIILESRHLAVIVEPPSMVHSVCAEFGLVKNNTRAFVFINSCITINHYFPKVTKFSGLLCDLQHVMGVF